MLQPDEVLTPKLTARLDAWIAAQPEPRPSRDAAIRRLLEEALAGVAAPGGYRATRVGADGPVEEWRGEAKDDAEAAHRLGQHLKTRAEQGGPAAPEDTVTLTRPDGEIVTVAQVREWIGRLTGWKGAAG